MRSTEFDNELLKHYSKVKAFCRSLCKNEDDAEDLLQTVYLKAFSSGIKSASGIISWLYTIARNQYINDYHRYNNNPVKTVESLFSNSSVDYQQHSIDSEKIWDRINNLAPRNKTVITLFVNGYKYREIADHMNITIGGVKSEMHFARKHFKSYK